MKTKPKKSKTKKPQIAFMGVYVDQEKRSWVYGQPSYSIAGAKRRAEEGQHCAAVIEVINDNGKWSSRIVEQG